MYCLFSGIGLFSRIVPLPGIENVHDDQRETNQNAGHNAAKKQLADTPVMQLVNQGSDLVKQGVGILLGFFGHDGLDEEFVAFDEIEKGDEILHSIL